MIKPQAASLFLTVAQHTNENEIYKYVWKVFN